MIAPDPSGLAGRRKRPSSPTAVILLYFIVVFVGAALIAPRLYASAQFLETIHYRFSFLADAPFHRYVNRCLILLAILGLPSLFRGLGLQSKSLLGLQWSARHFAEAIHGLCWSFIAVAILAALFVAFQVSTLDPDLTSERWISQLRNASLSALVVGLLEEMLFRGALFGALRQRQSFLRAALLSSALYALLHFLEKPAFIGRVHWDSGFIVLAQMLSGLTNLNSMIPAFLNLLLLGILLALVFERTGSLFLAIGLHAGLVFWMKTLNFLTDRSTQIAGGFWGTDKLTDAWATTLVLGLVFLLVERTLPQRREVLHE